MASPCGFEGDADFYGLGVRLGFYLQWVGTIAVTLLVPQDVKFFRSVNALFQIALLAALFHATVTEGPNLHAVEPVIIGWLLFGALTALSTDSLSPFGSVAGSIRLAIYSSVAAYAIWYWFIGLDAMELTPCGTVAFFGRVTPYGRFRQFNKVASVAGAALCVLNMVMASITLLRQGRAPRWSKYLPGIISPVRSPKGRSPQAFFAFLSIFISALSVAVVEYLIAANNISHVYNVTAVGQLLPLIAAIFGLIGVFVSIWDR